jgi:uncharacterized protein (DUF885 family)
LTKPPALIHRHPARPPAPACALLGCATVAGADHGGHRCQLRPPAVRRRWAERLRADPLYATTVGVHGYDDRLPAVTPADYARQVAQDRAFEQRLQALPRSALPPAGQLNYDLFDYELRDRIALAPFRDWRIPLTSDSGFHSDVLLMADGVAMARPEDYQRFIAPTQRGAGLFRAADRQPAPGLAEDLRCRAAVMPGVLKIIEGQQYATAETCPLYEPFRHFPDTIPGPEQQRLLAAGRTAIEARVLPAYRHLLEFFRDAYAPAARAGIAATQLPEGNAYYAALLRHYTTLDVTPGQVHQIGLDEVARIQGEMDAAMRATGFTGDFAAFLTFLRHPVTPPRRNSCSSAPPSSASRSTAGCRRISASCRACPTASSPCPPTSRPTTPPGATRRRRSAAPAAANTGSTRSRSTSGRCTRSPR